LEKVKMKKQSLTFSIVSVLVLLVSSTLVYADWSPGDDYKMHSPQLPNPAGYDVCLVHQPLADDFQCSESGFIRDIHFWVSWRGDKDDFKNVTWNIAINANSLGKPGRVLWTLNPPAGAKIAYRKYGSGKQDWLCPSTGLHIPDDHTNIYQVNITEISDPFYQTKGQVYWLAIQARMGSSTAEVGWKSSTSSYFGQAQYMSSLGGWLPIGIATHDLAFVITGGPLIEVDQISMSVPENDLITPIGKEKLTVSGPLTWKVFFEGPAEGDAQDDDGNGREEVELEIVDLDWACNSPLLGLVKLREHPAIPSAGLIEEQANNTPGKLDVPPFTPTGMAELSLDFYFEIEFGGQVLYTDQVSRLRAIINHKPPGPLNYFSVNQFLPLLNADGSISRSYFGLGNGWTRTFWEVDPFEFNLVKMELHKPAGGVETVELTGFSSMYTKFDGPGQVEGRANDNSGNGLDEVETEMAALDLSGTSSLGPVKMRLRPGIRSIGQIEEQVNNNPGLLDLPPFTATGTADSFFDVFFEIEIGGHVFHNVQPLRWWDVIDHKPPQNTSYENPDPQPISLVDEDGNPTGFSIGPSLYRPGYCGPIPIGDLNQDCIVNFFDFAIFASHWLECTRIICP
jgi:hypothetical protein